MKYVLILLVGMLMGCSQSTDPITPPVVKQTESVLPTLKKVDSNIDNSVQTNIKLQEKIKDQQQTVTDQKIAIAEAINDAEKLKNKILANEVITELETINMIEKLKKVEARNLFLEIQNSELSKVREDLEKLLQTLKLDSNKSLQQLQAKENETSQLREQTQYLNNIVKSRSEEVQKLKNDLTKTKVKAATAGVYRNWIIGIVSGFVLWTIIKNIIMIYSPIKFRI